MGEHLLADWQPGCVVVNECGSDRKCVFTGKLSC